MALKHVAKEKMPAWHAGNVSAKALPNMVRRTHMEHGALRAIFERIRPESIVEFGCGFGRLLPVAEEFTNAIVGLEREPAMVKAARAMFPALQIVQQHDLGHTPLADDGHDVAYSFTVLQHMSNEEATAAVAEMKRVARRWVLIVEETDPSYRRQQPNPAHFTIGRSVTWYRRQMYPWQLASIELRPNEPGYQYKDQPKPYSGHYMLFRAGS